MRARLSWIPLPLLAVLLAVLVEGLVWTFAVPALQGADESSHVAYVQKIADAGEIPWTTDAALQSQFVGSVSTEQRGAWEWAGLEPLRGNRAARPLWTQADVDIWRAHSQRLSRTDGGVSPSFHNPPLYYLLAAIPYRLAGASFFDRVFAMRLANLPLLLVTVWMTWLLAGEIFGRRRGVQTVAAAMVGLQPVLLDVTTRVTPDALLVPLSAVGLYLMAVVVRAGPRRDLVGGLALTCVAASFTQARGLGLLLPALLAVAVAWWRARAAGPPMRRVAVDGADAPLAAAGGGGSRRVEASLAAAGGGGSRRVEASLAAALADVSRPALAGHAPERRRSPGGGDTPEAAAGVNGSGNGAGAGVAVRPPSSGSRRRPVLAILAGALVLLLALAFYATRFRAGDIPGFFSYLWQFYLPALPGMSPPLGGDWGVEAVYLTRLFGSYVQFEVGLPAVLMDALRDALYAGLALVVVALWRRRDAVRRHAALAWVLVGAFVLEVLVLHAAAFRALLLLPTDPVFTGRYLLVLVPLFGCGVAFALTALPGRVRAAATGAVLAGAFVLQLAALGEVVGRFYA